MNYRITTKEYEEKINNLLIQLNKLMKPRGKEYRIEKGVNTKCMYLIQRDKYGDDRYVTWLSSANEILSVLHTLVTIEED